MRRASSRVLVGATSDLASLEPLWTALVEHHRELVGAEVPVRPAAQAWHVRRQEYQAWLDDGSGLLLVAKPAGSEKLSGYAFCRLVPSGSTFDLGLVRGEVESLVVAPDRRSTGIGTALLESCRQALQQRGCSYWAVSVVDGNRAAAELYQRLGFRPWVHELVGRLDEPGAR